MKRTTPKEFKFVALRECAEIQVHATHPRAMAEYWRTAIARSAAFIPTVENIAVVFLNTRCRVIGHQVIGVGILNAVLFHCREVFRGAISAGAHSICLMHNHPSGDPAPSREDVVITKRVAKASRIVGIHLVDHIVIGARGRHASLKEYGLMP